MNRSSRSHRSTKIPNVKLRPAAPQASTSTTGSNSKVTKRQRAVHNDEEDDAHFRQLHETGVDRGAHVDADFIGGSAQPLRGAIISMTGLGDAKSTLTKYASQMGAQVEGNLTEDVTHLIAEQPGSEKYRCALELGMHILHPDWIAECRSLWLQGDDVDPEKLQERHRLKPIQGIVLSLAGLSSPERRAMRSLATSIGARVSDDLRFDGSITHLVTGTNDPNASSSMYHLVQYRERARKGLVGSKEEAAAAMIAVWPEWLTDCQAAGGCLNEAHYSVFLPQRPSQELRDKLIAQAQNKISSPFTRASKHPQQNQQQKQLQQEHQSLAPTRVAHPFSSSSKRPRLSLENDSQAGPSHSITKDKAHVSLAGQDDEEEEQIIQLGPRPGAANAPGGSALARLKPRIASSGPINIVRESVSPHPEGPGSSESARKAKSGLLSISRANSFSQAQSTPAPGSRAKPSLRKRSSDGPTGCLAGVAVRVDVVDETKASVLKTALSSAGATVLDAEDASRPAQYCVVAANTSTNRKDKARAMDATIRGRPVTHYWIEYCLHYERLVEPDDYFASAPATAGMPLGDTAKDLCVYVLGLAPGGPESYHAHKLVEEIGGTVVERLRPGHVSHVLCATEESRKSSRAAKAAAQGIPLVGLEFLRLARSEGVIEPPVSSALVVSESRDVSTSRSTSCSSAAWPIDITNRSSNSDRSLRQRNDDGGNSNNGLALAKSGRALAGERGPLAGCLIACWRTTSSDSKAYEKKAFELGATFQLSTLDETTTHVLHRGATVPREVREGAPRARLVHPAWLDKCREDGMRVDERLFPSTMDPTRALETTVSQSANGSESSQAAVAAAPSWQRSLSAGNAQVGWSQDDKEEGESDEIARGRSASPLQSAGAEGENESLDRSATADQVMALLRSRAMEQSSKRRGRLPPRSRKRRGLDSRAPTLSSSTATTAEEVLARQAEEEAQRAADAAANGYSLGLEKLGNGSSQLQFDASLRIVYDDPAARRERKKLLDLAGRMDAAAEEEAETEPEPVIPAGTEAGKAGKAEEAEAEWAQESEHAFGRGLQYRGGEEGGSGGGGVRWRKSESPTKRPVVRRQPLARR